MEKMFKKLFCKQEMERLAQADALEMDSIG